MAKDSVLADQRDAGVMAWLVKEADKIEVMAREAADEFWKYHYESKVDADIKDWSTYGCRVRRMGTAVKIEWRFIFYVGPKGQRKIMSKDLSRGQHLTYTKRSFAKAREKELEEIMKAERVFSEVRRLSESLTKVVRQVDGYTLVARGVEGRLNRKVGEREKTEG